MSKLYWYVHQELGTAPSQIYQYPVKPVTDVKVCPQTKKLDKRIVEIPAPFDLLAKRALDGKYIFESNDVNYNNIQNNKPVLLTKPAMKDGDDNIHIAMPYVFLSDDKNLVGYQMAPNHNSKNIFIDCTFIEGIMPVGAYGRVLDLAINIEKGGEMQLFKGEALWRFVFTDEVELIHIDPTIKILKYVESVSHITQYNKGVQNIFKRAAKTYPYKELKNCIILK